VDPQLKQLMKELGDAINESLSDSEQISEVVSRIKEGGYDIFLVLEATIGVSKQGEKSQNKASLVPTMSTNPEFKMNDERPQLKQLMDERLKQLMKELNDAINKTLDESKLIAEVVSRIKRCGYDISLRLEASIGLSKQSGTTDKASFVTIMP
jgi:pentose-5-phosphate-3-epimerase